MKKIIILPALCLSLLMAYSPTTSQAQTTPPESGDLLDFQTVDASAFKTENGATVTVEEVNGAKAMKLAFSTSNSYPGVDLPGGPWNLTGYTGVIVTITNNSATKIGVGLRVDNPGNWQSSPWNSEVSYLAANETKTMNLTFGQSYGKPGFALDPSKVKNIKIMVTQPKGDGNIAVTAVKAVK